jgi:hypothetical protein
MAAKLATKALSKTAEVSMEAQRDDPRDYYHEVKLVGEHAPLFPNGTSMWFYPDYLFHTPGRYYVAPDSDLFVLPFLATNDGLTYLLLRKLDGSAFFERLGHVYIYFPRSEPLKAIVRTHVYSLPLSNITIV